MNKQRFIELKKPCEFCGYYEFAHMPKTPEDMERWECNKCGTTMFTPKELKIQTIVQEY